VRDNSEATCQFKSLDGANQGSHGDEQQCMRYPPVNEWCSPSRWKEEIDVGKNSNDNTDSWVDVCKRLDERMANESMRVTRDRFGLLTLVFDIEL
jgi:hypothetical protein